MAEIIREQVPLVARQSAHNGGSKLGGYFGAIYVNGPKLEARLRADRETTGADRYDEVWK